MAIEELDIQIGTSVDSASKGIDSLVGKVERLRDTLGGDLGNEAVENIAKLSESLSSLALSFADLEGVGENVKALTGAVRSLFRVFKESEVVQNATNNMAEFAIALREVNDAAQASGVNAATDSIRSTGEAVRGLSASGKEGSQSLNDLYRAASDLGSVFDQVQNSTGKAANGAQKAASGYANLNGQLRRTRASTAASSKGTQELTSAWQRFTGLARGATSALQNIRNSLSGVDKGSRRASKSLVSFGGIFRKAFNVAQIKLLRNVLNGLFQGVWEGFGEIAKVSASFNSAMSSMTTASNTLKGSLSAALAPALKAIAPLFTAAANAAAGLFNRISELIAVLTGQSVFYRAVENANDFAAGFDNASGSVKKLAKDLGSLPFDELHSLTEDLGNSGGGGGGGYDGAGFEEVPVSDVFAGWRDLLETLLDPIFAAWENKGDDLIAAWQRAFVSLKDAAADVGETLLEVWTNGSGQLLVENLLDLFTDLGLIIGDIAIAFRNAWSRDGLGVVQSYFDRINALLGLIHDIAGSFRTAWNEAGYGEAIIGRILRIVENTNRTAANLTENFRAAWNAGGAGDKVMRGVLGVIDSILGVAEGITLAISEWAADLDFLPFLESVADALEPIQHLITAIGDLLVVLWNYIIGPVLKILIEDLIPGVITVIGGIAEALAGVIDFLVSVFTLDWQKAWGGIKSFTEGLWTGLKGLFGATTTSWSRDSKIATESIVGDLEDVEGAAESATGTIASRGQHSAVSFRDDIAEAAEDSVAAFDDVALAAENAADAITHSSEGAYRDASDAAQGSGDLSVDALDNLALTAEDTFESLDIAAVDAWEAAKDASTAASEAMENEAFTLIADSSSETFEELAESAVDAWDTIKENYIDAPGWLDINVLNPITASVLTQKATVLGAFQEIREGFKDVANAIIGHTNAMLAGIERAINFVAQGLNGLAVSFPSWVPDVGGQSFSPDISPISAQRIPALAVGMSFVPSDDFLAFLHRGEAVLTASEASLWRRLGGYAGVLDLAGQRQVYDPAGAILPGYSLDVAAGVGSFSGAVAATGGRPQDIAAAVGLAIRQNRDILEQKPTYLGDRSVHQSASRGERSTGREFGGEFAQGR